ncbi:hypothetical protein GGR54DRAFT_501602 [Hypoxylon sp. NC1633]|nr:hypothetical protein GGR54DRAFT_501602 [Hypoxylon sp. NC1633]
MSGKASSEGTKVSGGQNAPVTNESTGLVIAEGSLAAESQTFRKANQAVPQQVPRENLTSASRPHESGVHKAAPSSFDATYGQGDYNASAAPSYVQSQYIKDQSGPHGKNLKEDDSIGTEDKTKNTSFSEFGTKNDPGLAAEQKFTRSNATGGGSTGGREKGVDSKQPYEALGGDTEA